jgi:hypothetical protein
VKLIVEMTLSEDFASAYVDSLIVMRRSEAEAKWPGILE